MVGPNFQYYNTTQTPDRFSASLGDGSIPSDRSQYIGLTLDYEYELKDKKILPTRGIYFNLKGNYNYEYAGKNISNIKFHGQFSLYTPVVKNLTYIFNVSGTRLFDDFEYYHAASLGSRNFLRDNDVLRGYRKNRFNGRSGMAFNNELRLKLFDVSAYIAPGQFGINAFVDVGRVWYDGQESSVWHNNVGGGIWYTPLDVAVLNIFYSYSKEENVIRVNFGFLF